LDVDEVKVAFQARAIEDKILEHRVITRSTEH